MALDTATFSSSYITLAIVDYTGSPISTSVPTLFGDIILPRTRMLEHTTPMVNSTSGKVPYAVPVHGLVAQPTFTFQFYAVDINDNSETTAIVALVKALSANSVAGTAYSTYVFTNPLTGGGKLTAKFTFIETNTAGTTHTTTVPAVVTSVVDGVADGVKICTVTCEIVGALTQT